MGPVPLSKLYVKIGVNVKVDLQDRALPHFFGVSFHNRQVSANNWRKICLVDNQKITLCDARACWEIFGKDGQASCMQLLLLI